MRYCSVTGLYSELGVIFSPKDSVCFFVEYINEAYHDEDPRMFLIALGNAVRSKGVSKVAQETGLGRESLYKIFSGSASPKWNTLKKLLDNLGIEICMRAKSA